MVCNAETEKHLKQARINEELVLFLKNNCNSKKFFNWIFVASFYSALHYFCAFLSNRGDTIPDSHVGKNGGNDLARDKFFTTKNEITEAVGEDYKQLYQWGYDVRYKPERAKNLGKENLKSALNYLEKVKFVTFNDTGFMPKKTKSKNIVVIEAKEDYLKKMHSFVKGS